MNIGIYNGKAEIAGAFANAMSLSQAHGSAINGYEVAIITHSTTNEKRVLPADYFNENSSDIYEIRSTSPIEELSVFDWIIWNSYRPQDNEILKAIRERGVRVTKSFPRLLGSSELENRLKLKSRLNSFDFVAFALQSDSLVSKSLDVSASKADYVPRGFMSKLLSSDKSSDYLQICIDGPVRPNLVEKTSWRPELTIQDLIEALRVLKKKYPMLKLISSRVGLGIEGSIRLKSLPIKEFYQNFFWNSDIYIGPSFLQSRQGENGFLGDGYSGVYENQVVEAQMCGAAVLGSKFSIAQELVSPFQSSSAIDFSNVDSMIYTIEDILKETLDLRSQIAIWTKERHCSATAMKSWLSKLQNFGS